MTNISKFARKSLRIIGWLLGSCALPMLLAPPASAEVAAQLRIIVPFQAGGTADLLPRIVGEKLQSHYPGGVIVENRPGAGGNIGAQAAYRADPDGSTLLASPPGPIAINQHLYQHLNFEPARWVPITVLATIPNVLAVSNRLPVHNVAEFIAYAKANPGKVSFASQGNGSTPHLTAELFMKLTGTKMLHVPYKGSAPAQTDLISGQVDCFFDNLSASKAFHDAGKFRILAVADEQRSAALPGVPTFKEAGLPSMVAVTWFAIVAPPTTSEAVANRIQAQISAALKTTSVRKSFAARGAAVADWTPEATRRFVAAESEKWKQVIQDANVKLD